MTGRKEETALGTARARFAEGLPRKAKELKGAVALLASTPDATRPREELRRRLHALYASAQVFRLDALADALRDAIGGLDAARDEGRPLGQDELDSLASLAATLPALVQGAAPGTPSTAPPAGRAAPASEPAPRTTRRGIPAFEPPPAPTPEAPDARAHPPRTTLPGMRPSEPLPPPTAKPETREHRPSTPPPRRPAGSFTAAGPSSERPSTRPPAPLDTVISVLVVDDVESQAKIRAALPAEGFELVGASDPEQGLRLARMGAPDVVVANRDLVTRPGVDFISRLRSDPLTDFVPVVLLLPAGTANDLVAVREEGADETLGKPFEPAELVRVIVRVTGGSDCSGPFEHLGDLTPTELADRLSAELRRGIVESAEGGRDVRIPMGEGSEVLAAAWSAIARVRATIAQRSGGRVRFRDSARRGGPAVMALVDDEVHDDVAGDASPVDLTGRRIVVADDDPAVVWFFAGLLREEGADVFEAENGREALDEARRRRPDLVISDILMPEVDGFELCRELSRDPALADVPVILLSWKEDFLQRMRDLQSGASGYLRKEAGSAQILSRVRDVLRPRARLEAQLEAGGEVRGRIEGIGVLTLLRTVAEHRPDARVTARDAWNLYEVDVRRGDLVDVTRTATDGSFARGPRALPQLLGVTTGRFTVADADGPVRGTFDAPLERALADGTARLGALLDAVSGRGMRHAASVDLDEDVLASFLRTSPEPVKKLVERMRSGEGPRDLLLDDAVAPHAVESALVDLARRGAVAAVRGPGGEDRVAQALERRAGMAPRRIQEPAAPAQEKEEEDAGEGLSWLPSEETTGDIVRSAERMAAERARRRGRKDSVDELDLPFTGGDEDEPAPAEPKASSPPAPEPPAPEQPADREADEPDEAADQEADEPDEPDDDEPDEADEPDEPDDDEPPEPEPIALSRPSKRPRPPPPPSIHTASTLPPRAPEPDELPGEVRADDRSEPGTLGWIFLLIVLAVLGFVGYELIEGGTGDREDQPPASSPPPAAGEGTDEGPASPAPPTADEDVPPEELSFGRTLDHVEEGAGVEVGAGEGLLVVEPGAGREVEVSVGERELGAPPVRVALPAGRHELVFRRGEETSYRYLYIRAGQTRIVDAP